MVDLCERLEAEMVERRGTSVFTPGGLAPPEREFGVRTLERENDNLDCGASAPLCRRAGLILDFEGQSLVHQVFAGNPRDPVDIQLSVCADPVAASM